MRLPIGQQGSVVLSERERQVLALVARGQTTVACGHRLGISPATVRKHLEHVYAKLGVHDRLVAVDVARRLGLIDGYDAPPSVFDPQPWPLVAVPYPDL